MRDQSVDSKREFESLYRDVMVINSQLEAKILELQDQMTRSGMGKGHAYTPAGKREDVFRSSSKQKGDFGR